jgi:hypothetical protein
MRLLNKKPKEIRAHELTLGHKVAVGGDYKVWASIRAIRLTGSLFVGNRVEVDLEFGGRTRTESYGWTDKVAVK